MESPSRKLSAVAASGSFVVRLFVLCVTAAAWIMLAAAPAEADHKHKHKHKHHHRHHHYYHHHYDDHDDDVVVIVKPRPAHPPRVVHHYHPVPVHDSPLLNIVIPVHLD